MSHLYQSNVTSSSAYMKGHLNFSQQTGKESTMGVSGLKSAISQNSKVSQRNPHNSQREIQYLKTVDFKDLKEIRKEDEYIEQLHKHVEFLNQEIIDMKRRQDENQNGIVNMLGKSDRRVVDHVVDTQSKYKGMKQQMIEKLHLLEADSLRLETEMMGLQAVKDYLVDMLDQIQIEFQKMQQTNAQEIFKLKESYKTNQEQREDSDRIFEELTSKLQRLTEERIAKEKIQKEKYIKDQIDQDRYDEDKKQEEQDKQDQLQQIEQLKAKIQKIRDEFETNEIYRHLKGENKVKREQLINLEMDLEKQQFSMKELGLLLKHAQEEKDNEGGDQFQMKQEFDKYTDTLVNLDLINQKKIQAKFDITESKELRETQAKLNKLQKENKEKQDKQNEAEALYKQHAVEDMHLTYKENDIVEKVDRLTEEFQAYSALKEDQEHNYNAQMAIITKDHEMFTKLKEEQGLLLKQLRESEEQRAYVVTKLEHLRTTVNLQDEMQKIRIDELRNVTINNTQFNSLIATLQESWEEMRKIARVKYQKMN